MCKWTPRYYAELDGRTPPNLRRETHAGTVLGTPGYMGASQEEDDAEFRDVFGLGATLHRVVTGRMPYKAEPEVGDVLQWQDAERERRSPVSVSVSVSPFESPAVAVPDPAPFGPQANVAAVRSRSLWRASSPRISPR